MQLGIFGTLIEIFILWEIKVHADWVVPTTDIILSI